MGATRAMGTTGHDGPVESLRARLAAAIDDLVALDADTLTVDEAGRLLEVVDRERNRLDGARARMMASFSRREGHRQTGHKSLSHWMQDKLRRSPNQARKEAKTAEQLAGLSSTADALGNGEISLEHAAAVAEQASKAEDPEGAQRSLLAEARRGDPGRVRKAGRRMRRDEDRRAEEARKVRRAKQQRTLTFRRDDAAHTVWIEGRLPMLAGVEVSAVVDALAAPAGRDDDRSYGQRMADGLVELARMSGIGSGSGSATGSPSRDRLPPQRGVPVEIMAVVPVEALEGRAGVPAGTICGQPGGGIDLSDVELAELIDRARLSWLMVDPDGVPLRYGKARRFASTHQRRILRARDGGCAWPRCDGPAVWCLAHHEPPFDEPGGATDLGKLIALCDTHHGLRHDGGWTLQLSPSGTVTVTSPDGRTVLTETATERRARHGTWELSTASDAREDHAHYHVGLDPGAHPGEEHRGRCLVRERRDPGCARDRAAASTLNREAWAAPDATTHTRRSLTGSA